MEISKEYSEQLDRKMHEVAVGVAVKILMFFKHTDIDLKQRYKESDIVSKFNGKVLRTEIESRCVSDFDKLWHKTFYTIHVPARKRKSISDAYIILPYCENPDRMICISKFREKLHGHKDSELIKNKHCKSGDSMMNFKHNEASMFKIEWENNEIKSINKTQ